MNRVALLIALLLAPLAAQAIEVTAGSNDAAKASVEGLLIKISTTVVKDTEQVLACAALRKFYAPSDPKRDASGCVGVGDYDLNLASGSSHTFANGAVRQTGNMPAGYAASFNNANSGGYGVYAQSANYIGVYGESPASWAGYFYGAYGAYGNGGTGVMAAGASGVRGDGGTYGGYFTGTNGMAVLNNNNTANLCFGGACKDTLYYQRFGGSYGQSMATLGAGAYIPACEITNPYTGGCSCPGGLSPAATYSFYQLPGKLLKTMSLCL